MERLSEVNGNTEAKTAMDLCKEFVESWHTDEEFLRLASAFPRQLPYPGHMLSLLKQIREQTHCFKKDCSEEQEGRMLDMHYGNFLLRDDAIIVTDPWRESDMENNNNVDDWASSRYSFS